MNFTGTYFYVLFFLVLGCGKLYDSALDVAKRGSAVELPYG